MKLLLTIIGILLADRAIPYGAWGYGVKFFKIDEREFLRRYGLISFPRTLLAAGVCVAAGLDLIFPISKDLQSFLMVSLTVLFGVAALVDVWKARR
jgi:hypothetical protein